MRVEGVRKEINSNNPSSGDQLWQDDAVLSGEDCPVQTTFREALRKISGQQKEVMNIEK